MHCFVENRAVARRPPAVCLTAIFAKIAEKRRNPGQTLFGCTVLSCHQEVCLPLFGVPQKMPLVTATRLTPVHPGAMTDSKFVPSNGSSSSSSVRPSPRARVVAAAFFFAHERQRRYVTRVQICVRIVPRHEGPHHPAAAQSRRCRQQYSVIGSLIPAHVSLHQWHLQITL